MAKLILGIVLVFFLSCNSEPSLQKYFVDHSEASDFIALDLGASIINTEKVALSQEEKETLKAFKKLNIIAFVKDSVNEDKYKVESEKVKELLKKETYQELMKMGSGSDGGAVYFVGDEDHIDEFVLFANRKENGFAVVRILGEDMNPSQLMSVMSLLQKADIDLEQLKPLKGLMN